LVTDQFKDIMATPQAGDEKKQQSFLDDDRPAKRHRLATPDSDPTAKDIDSILNGLQENERLVLFGIEARRNPEILKSLRQYFDIVNNNSTAVSIEKFMKLLRIQSPPRDHNGEYDNLRLDGWKTVWGKAIQQVLPKINHRSLPSTIHNALTALRTIGRAEVREGVYLREEDIICTMRTITGRMTKDERRVLIGRYGSLKALSNFRRDFPSHYNPPWLQKLWPVRASSPCKEGLDDAGFWSDSNAEKGENGAVDESKTGSVEDKEMEHEEQELRCTCQNRRKTLAV
jgi:hypothetical protein